MLVPHRLLGWPELLRLLVIVDCELPGVDPRNRSRRRGVDDDPDSKGIDNGSCIVHAIPLRGRRYPELSGAGGRTRRRR